MALIGYARASTVGQTLENQIELLHGYGCNKIFKEKQSGAKSNRIALHEH